MPGLEANSLDVMDVGEHKPGSTGGFRTPVRQGRSPLRRLCLGGPTRCRPLRPWRLKPWALLVSNLCHSVTAISIRSSTTRPSKR
jgi:hypothetical protein